MNHDFSRGLAAFVLSCLGLLILSGCHQIQSPAVSGQGSFEFIKRPAGNRISEAQAVLTGSEPKDVFMPAAPDGSLAVPIYPSAALAAHVGRVTVGLEITIGTDGRVADVHPGFAGIPFNGSYSASFQAAAEVAMAQWKFHPAEMRHFEPRQEGGETIWSLASAERRDMTTEVSFTFNETGETVRDNKIL